MQARYSAMLFYNTSYAKMPFATYEFLLLFRYRALLSKIRLEE
jgi:hypothetical protein